MMRYTLALPLALILAACGQEAEPELAPSEDAQVIDAQEQVDETTSPLPPREMLEALLAEYDVPGMAIATIEGCEVGTVEAYGTAIVESETPVEEMTAFEAASLSKPVFAWLVMTLVDEGVIDLDTPLAETMAWPRIGDADAYQLVTPRMILTHRTGMPNWVGDSNDFERTDTIPFETPPGDAYSYSGEAFQMLQAYVSQATGRSLQELFEERLGETMPHSTFTAPLPDTVSPSRGYENAEDAQSGRDLALRDEAMAAASLVTVAGDYAAFLAMVCRGDGLSEAVYDDMLTPQSPVPAEDGMPPSSYGLGFQLAQAGPESLVFHSGNNGEYRAFAGYERTTGDGVVVLANGAQGWAVMEPIIGSP